MKLRLVNDTHYRTDQIRALVAAGIRELGDGRRYLVRVRYRRGREVGRGSSGWAYYNSGEILLRVCRYAAGPYGATPVPAAALPAEDVRDLALVLAHEIAHTNGVRHSEMDCALKRCHAGGTNDAPVPWADGLVIEAKPTKPKPTADDRAAAREARARALLETWERRAKAAARKVAKYRRTVTYYERRAAATGGAR